MYATPYETRVLYLLAKAGRPVRKRMISTQTGRWKAIDRDRTLMALEQRELIKRQATPGGEPIDRPTGGKPPGNYYWLTDAGIDAVEWLKGSGVITTLADNWRQQYGTNQAAVLPGGGGSKHPGTGAQSASSGDG